MLAISTLIDKKENTVPNFLGKPLKQSIKDAKLTGIIIQSTEISGRVVWQSVMPWNQVHNNIICQIKLESM